MAKLGDYVWVYGLVGTPYVDAGKVRGHEYTQQLADLIDAGYMMLTSRPSDERPGTPPDSEASLATIAKVKSLINERSVPDYLSEEALSDTYASIGLASRTGERDGGLAFMQNVRFEGAIRAGLAGDSTGNAVNEWFDLVIKRLGATHPDQKYNSVMLDPTSLKYNAPIVVQPGTTPEAGVKARDTFTGSPGELVGSKPTLGANWSTDGSNGNGDWVRDGSGGVDNTAETTRGAHFLDLGTGGDMETRVDLTIDTTTAAVARSIRVFTSYKSSTDHLFGNVTISQTTGAATLQLYKRVGNVATKVNTGTDPVSTAITANKAGQSLTLRSKLENGKFTLTVTGNGKTDTLSVDLTADDLGAVYGGTKGGIGIQQAGLLPARMTLVELSLLNSAAAPEAWFWNSSISGSRLESQQLRLAELFPEKLDVLFLSAGHNYQQRTPAEMFTLIDDFVTAFRKLWPDTPIIITGQNPEFAPATARAAHNDRQKSLKAYCRERGFGYVPVTASWLGQVGKGRDLVQADGIHPTIGDTDTGSSFWADQVLAYLNAL